MASINPQKIKALADRFEKLGIKDSELEEKFIRAQGKGGQKLNKTSSCVRLKHLPSGIEVKCQQERSQSANRFLARRLLADRIEETVLGEQSASSKKIEKLRKQKQRRHSKARKKVIE